MPTAEFAPVIRAADSNDAAAMNTIYNHYIQNTTVTFDIEPWDLARREHWLSQFNAAQNPYHAFVAECEEGIAGFAYNSQFRAKAAYRYTTEITVYIASDCCDRGFGVALYQALFARLAATNLHRAIAVIALPNPRSIAFHRRFGFTQIGVLSQVGHKFGRYIDTAWLEKALK